MEECAICGFKLVNDTREITFTRKDKSVVKVDIEGLYCNKCGEGFFSDENLNKVEHLIHKKK